MIAALDGCLTRQQHGFAAPCHCHRPFSISTFALGHLEVVRAAREFSMNETIFFAHFATDEFSVSG